MKITVLYGTETGNAEMLAEDIVSELSDHEAEAINLADFAPGDFDPATLYLLVCSTYGDGELPASAQPFAAAMQAEAPELAGVHFGIFGMGDSEYEETFNHGPKALAALMLARGATQLGERVAHDASGSELAEDLAFPWAAEIVGLADEALGQAA
jgi:MioC protein